MRQALISTLLLASTGTLCLAQHSSAQLEVTAVRFWSFAEVTRIAIETNGEFHFRSDKLFNPDRLFFDLLGTKPRMGVKGVQTTVVNDKLLKRIRVAETQPGMTRVVLDLESAVEFKASQLSNPDRLMIELRAAGSAPVSSVQPPAEPSAAPPAAAEPVAVAAVVAEKPAVLEKPILEKPIIEKPIAAEKPAVPPPPPALAARRNSTGDRRLIRALGLKVGRVVIDPGHGGHDQGSIGPAGLQEKELVLDVAQRLGKLIETRLGSEVIYTRDDDTFIPLESRTEHGQ